MENGDLASLPIPPFTHLQRYWFGDGEYKDSATIPPFSDEFATRLPYAEKFEACDFNALAKGDPAFKELWEKTEGRLNFQDPATSVALAKAILKVDFNLKLELPDDRLCPPIPNRFSYVYWIQRLIDGTDPDYNISDWNPNRKVIGLDIGTGASAIYTMLCLQTRIKWTMCATDIDKKSFDWAVRNLAINRLATRAKMIQTIDSNPLIPLQHLNVETLDFTMCNPPFFNNPYEMRASLRGDNKAAPPNSICTGAEVEMVCPGGDLGFVTRIFEESLILGEKVGWYTSLLGKLDSAKAIIALLKNHDINNWVVGVIDMGKTKRWIVGWSFGDRRPPTSFARPPGIPHELLPLATDYRITLPVKNHDDGFLANAVADILSSLKWKSWKWDRAKVPAACGIGEATKNVWNRAFRRQVEREARRLAAGGNPDVEMKAAEEEKVVMAFRVRVWESESLVVADWLRGTDHVIWESFCVSYER
ncbi:hypothetical protein DM02DRAFT_727572 [Periconia macrospinosa]|uniref:U6 small nuclear RNA (adenine-(43)-N(6))-methyltransferase n=1 Tax=Periconia macrospinosa TaxID=97972 RepID=A0A2V1DVE0_9PLEO|nr:hypothetical protein DM02DRAFT_727572 [Periconia macrospinosa]